MNSVLIQRPVEENVFYTTSNNILIQNAPDQNLLFKNPLNNVVSCYLTLISDMSAVVAPGPHIALQSNALSGYAQGGTSSVGTPENLPSSRTNTQIIWIQQWPLPTLSNQVPSSVFHFPGYGIRMGYMDVRLFDPDTNLNVTMPGGVNYWMLTTVHKHFMK